MPDYKVPVIVSAGLTTGDLLRWDGSDWVNYPDSNYADEKVKIDADAAAGYLGAANNDGVLRAGNSLSYADGGNFITLDTIQDIRTIASPTFAGLTLTGNIIIPNDGYIGSVGMPTAIQIDASGDITMISDLIVTNDLVIDALQSAASEHCHIDIVPATDEIAIFPGYTSGDNWVVFKSVDSSAASPQIYPSSDNEGQLGLTDHRWNKLWVNDIDLDGNISGADIDINAGTGDLITTGDVVFGRVGVAGYQQTFYGNTLYSAIGSAYAAQMYIIAGEAKTPTIYLFSNEGTDNDDKWLIQNGATANQLRCMNKTSGSFVTKFYLNPVGEAYFPDVYSDSHGGTGRAMYIQSDGQLTCDTSARRFKENIKDLSDTSWIYDLIPREADWKNSNVKADPVLIAEEVELVNPKLISHAPKYRYESHKKVGPNGEDETEDELVEVIETNIPEGVQYYKLIVPMLKEIQKLKQEIDKTKKSEK